MERRKEYYAKLILEKGVALKPGQIVLVNAQDGQAEFAEGLAVVAYRMGASQVEVQIESEGALRAKLRCASNAALARHSGARWEESVYFLRRGACVIDLLAGTEYGEVDAERLQIHNRALIDAQREYRRWVGTSRARWCTAAVPDRAWARQVFPGAPDALERLWQLVLRCCFADTHEVCALWQGHLRDLERRARRLNAMKLRQLHFTSKSGTDLKIGLMSGAVWTGGSDVDRGGVRFSPNLPTEEVWTVPHKLHVSGTLVASRPVCWQGMVIEGLALRFREGAVHEYTCRGGREAIESIFALDSGMRRLGEVALVTADSPLAQNGTLYYNTLLDENAACHIALGSGAPAALGARNMAEAKKRGLNTAPAHVDIPFGTGDTQCIGRWRDGGEVVLLRNGRWAFE